MSPMVKGREKTMSRSIKIVVVVLASAFLIVGTAHAKGPFTKFGRGVTNLITFPAELVYQPMAMGQDNNALVAIFGGVPKGFVFVPVRALLGAYDVSTFFIPLPKKFGYWVEPETLIEGFDGLKYGESLPGSEASA